jgi:hypothetical protein
MKRIFGMSLTGLGGIGMLAIVSAAGPVQYPETKRTDLVEEQHGVKVPDPYRWLENDVRTDPEVRAWVDKQSKLTEDYLKSIPEASTYFPRITACRTNPCSMCKNAWTRKPGSCSTPMPGLPMARSRSTAPLSATMANCWPMPFPKPGRTGRLGKSSMLPPARPCQMN